MNKITPDGGIKKGTIRTNNKRSIIPGAVVSSLWPALLTEITMRLMFSSLCVIHFWISSQMIFTASNSLIISFTSNSSGFYFLPDKRINALAIENQSLLNLGTSNKALWKKAFIYPVKDPVVTDPYSYSRLTGAYTITHKGTDFRAPVGTEIYAINDGEVKLARYGRNYGNTIVIDHGNGIMSMYMHLSEMRVKVGDKVTRNQLIGLSGQTGYAEAPHLHFTLRISDVSVDPEVFLEFFAK